MANNTFIQIKRSTTTATPTSLLAGELAWSNASQALFIGNPDASNTVVAIGGARNPGTLTANQALVANSTSGLNSIQLGNAVFVGTGQTLSFGGSTGVAGYALFSNGSSNAYWASIGGLGVNTQQSYAFTNTITFSGPGNTAANSFLVVGANLVANSLALTWVGNTTTSPTISLANTGSFTIGNSTTTQTTSVISVANSTGNVQITPAGITGNGYNITSINATSITNGTLPWTQAPTGTANLSAVQTFAGNTTFSANVTINGANVVVASGVISGNGAGITSVNAAALAGYNFAAPPVIGSSTPNNAVFVTANVTTLNLGANVSLDAIDLVFVGNTTTSPSITLANTGAFTIGNSTTTQTTSIISVANSTGNVQITPGTTSIIASGVVNASSFGTGAIGTGAGGSVQNTTTIFVGNNTLNTSITAAGLVVNGTAVIANNSGVYTTGVVNGATLSVGTVVVANSSTLNANGLVVNSTGAYVSGLVNSTSFNAGAIGTGAGGSVQNTTTIFVGNNTLNTSITAAGLVVNGTAVVANNSGVWSTGTINAAAHTIGSTFIANTTKITFTGANVDATSAFMKIADLNVTGNLIVSGTVTTIDTQTLIVNDNIIELGRNNIATDTVDSGWYSPAGNSSVIWYSGLVRQAAKSSNSAAYFWLFGSNTNPNTSTTVDTSANSTTALLQAYLVPYGTGGAFVANSTTVNIVANSTVNVNITANTLSLSSALGYASGGTGQTSYAAGDLLYASATNTLSKLSVPGSAANGQVLQITNNLPAYGSLDGGTF